METYKMWWHGEEGPSVGLGNQVCFQVLPHAFVDLQVLLSFSIVAEFGSLDHSFLLFFPCYYI